VAESEQYFAWLPSVPQGRVEATIQLNGVAATTTGIGYHDHNWATPDVKLMHHCTGAWRGRPYSVIASSHDRKPFGYTELPIFMLARDGQVIADDSTKVTFEELGRYTDSDTGKPVGNVTRYTYADPDTDDRYAHLDRLTYLTPPRWPTPSRAPKKPRQTRRSDGPTSASPGDLRIDHYRADALLESHTAAPSGNSCTSGKARH